MWLRWNLEEVNYHHYHRRKQKSTGAVTVWIGRRVYVQLEIKIVANRITLCCGSSLFFNSLWCWKKGANQVAVTIHIINTSWCTKSHLYSLVYKSVWIDLWIGSLNLSTDTSICYMCVCVSERSYGNSLWNVYKLF